LAWDTPEDHVVELKDEVESWLRTRRDESVSWVSSSNIILRMAFLRCVGLLYF
jgi:hypothetical protein